MRAGEQRSGGLRAIRPRTWRNIVLLAVIVVLVNLPLAHSTYEHHRLAADGVDVTATVTGANSGGNDYGITFRFDAAQDPDQRDWPASVDRATYDTARSTKQVQVRVLPGTPSVYRVDGEEEGHGDVILTVAVDVLLLAAGLLFWRFRRVLGGAAAGPLRLVALEDATRPPPGAAIDELVDGTYLVVGEVVTLEPGVVELDCGRAGRVRVELDGHRCDIGHEQPARVRGRLSDSTP